MRFQLLTTSTLLAALAAPALADPMLGFGVSFAFGGGKVEPGVGLRVFSDDEQDTVVGSLGVDYMLQSQRLRPTVGAAYLGDDLYIGADVGYDFSTGGFDFGLSGGVTKTEDHVAPMSVVDPTPTPEPTPDPKPGCSGSGIDCA